MSKERKVSQTEINKRIKQVTMEADFRFKCLELASPISKKIEDLLENASKIYNYSFHIKENKDESDSK
jgi:hypothetical protein|tara:strand:+ start:6278 stop:6481 length:204 start_codon:yes stop_codon:yes gene_type:complete